MAKAKVYELDADNTQVWIFCPGCNTHHAFTTKAPLPLFVPWIFNGDVEKPTFKPSMLVNRGTGVQCHSFVTDGKIQFLSDCFHSLKNTTVELPDIED